MPKPLVHISNAFKTSILIGLVEYNSLSSVENGCCTSVTKQILTGAYCRHQKRVETAMKYDSYRFGFTQTLRPLRSVIEFSGCLWIIGTKGTVGGERTCWKNFILWNQDSMQAKSWPLITVCLHILTKSVVKPHLSPTHTWQTNFGLLRVGEGGHTH